MTTTATPRSLGLSAAKRTPDTIGLRPATIDALWRQFTDAIDTAYHASKGDYSPTSAAHVLRDYVTNVGWSDALAKLEKAEQADERAHRGFGPNYAQYHRPVSVNHCARLQILHQAGEGAKRGVMPPATDFLVCRRAAIEAQILGVLVAPHAPAGWIDACVALDYAAVVSKPDAA